MMKKLILVTLLFFILAPLASAASIGVTPGYIGYGEINTGETIEIDFYVTTSQIDEVFEIDPEFRNSLRYAIGDNGIVDMRNVSEQDISNWIEFEKETFRIDPSTTQTYELPDGTNVNAEGVISLNVEVPPNTEPGYRIGSLNLNPSIGGDGAGTGAKLVAKTVPGFSFRVPGSVNRNIDAVGTEAVRIGESRVQIINQFRNTGSVTTTLTGGEVAVLDSAGNKVGSIGLNSVKLAPGEYAEVDDTWVNEDLSGGEYQLEGRGGYRTGEVYVSGEFVVTDTITERRSIESPDLDRESTNNSNPPYTLIVIISLLLATVLYMVNIRLKWIVIFTGLIFTLLRVVLTG